ncbi:hypothetical protein ACFVFS_36585 [Kitasatospora sp. NPDC057692]|uniref:hypothetical protein n=1 Tax=Kitasatospora sp. NPDC057692 TaxID=3346215 RepID=UPI003690A968
MDELNDTAADGRGLSATFTQAVGGVGADLGPLVAGAAAQGRRIRRRRRTAVTGAVAAVAVLATGGAVALQPGDGSAADDRIRAASSTGHEQQVPGTGANAGKVALTGHAALQALIQALPPGGTTSGYSGSSTVAVWNDLSFGADPWPEPGRPSAENFGPSPADPGVRSRGTLSYDDGTGPATITVAVSGNIGGDNYYGDSTDQARARSHVAYDFSCGMANFVNQLQHCSDAVLPDGGLLLVTEQAEGDRLVRTVDLLRADHTQVRVRVTNAAKVAGASGYTLTRSGLPLSLDQLKALAMTAGFQDWITPGTAQQAEQAVQPFQPEPLSTPRYTTVYVPADPATGDPAPVR